MNLSRFALVSFLSLLILFAPLPGSAGYPIFEQDGEYEYYYYAPGKLGLRFSQVPLGSTITWDIENFPVSPTLDPVIGASFIATDPAFTLSYSGCSIAIFEGVEGTICRVTVEYTPTQLSEKCSLLHVQTQGAFSEGDLNYDMSLCGSAIAPRAPTLNLAVTRIHIPDAVATADGLTSVRPETQLTANVTVTGTGFNANETRSTNLVFKIGAQSFTQTVNLSDIKTSGSYTVPFTFTIPSSEVGKLSVEATLNSAKTPAEANYADNEKRFSTYAFCDVETPAKRVNFFSQFDPAWDDKDYDHTTDRMDHYACYISALAMTFDFQGISKTPDGSAMDPWSLNVGLKTYNWNAPGEIPYAYYSAYTPGGGVLAQGAALFAQDSFEAECVTRTNDAATCATEAAAKIKFRTTSDYYSPANVQKVNAEICKGNPVILRVASMSEPKNVDKSHFVLATAMTVDANGEFGHRALNPGRLQRTSEFYPAAITKFRGFRLFTSPSATPALRSLSTLDSAPSSIFIYLSGMTDMVVTDPLGRRSGQNPITGEVFDEIPNGNYFRAESISSAWQPGKSTTPETRFETQEAIEGNYTAVVYGDASGTYRVLSYKFDSAGKINGIDDKAGSVILGQTAKIEISHTAAQRERNALTLKISKALFHDSVVKDRALVMGTLRRTNGLTLPAITKEIRIQVGDYVKIIDANKIQKVKILKRTIYLYSAWGKDGIAFELDSSTGNFVLYFNNIVLDDNGTSLQSTISIRMDDLNSQSPILFTNVRKRNHGR